jgi:hypothetical protein
MIFMVSNLIVIAEIKTQGMWEDGLGTGPISFSRCGRFQPKG